MESQNNGQEIQIKKTKRDFVFEADSKKENFGQCYRQTDGANGTGEMNRRKA